MSAKLDKMKKRIMDLLDEKGITDETLKLVQDYWIAKETCFETKMGSWKIRRANRFEWERPVLHSSFDSASRRLETSIMDVRLRQ